MNIMELGAIGELVGGVAVIGSLIYVGFQVRQSNALNRAESIRAFARDYNNFMMQVKDPNFTDIWRRGSADFYSLSRTEQTQLHQVLLYHFMLGWADSLIDPTRSNEFAEFLDTGFAAVIRTPGFGQWWEQFKGLVQGLNPDYYDRIEALDPPNMLEFIPWFAPENSELEDA